MKNVRNMVFLALAVVLGAVIIELIPGRRAVPQATSKSPTIGRTAESSGPRSTARPTEPQVVRTPRRQARLLQESPAPSGDRPLPESVRPEAQTTAPAKQGTPSAPEVLQDPAARVALAYVGADTAAEMYWYAAINNPSLSAHERQDLIEDLNEDGLSDPKNPTVEDLPLILNRIQLIEAVAGDAMDQVNADAFQEAYKDLVNLAFQVLANG
jgi:hypothetical protein